MTTGDHQLLREFVEQGSQAAFAELVNRHLGLVHTVARRQLDDADRAQDVSQLVFTDLARKAGALPPGLVLAAWLHRATVLAARQVRRSERRRQQRERLAMELNPSDHSINSASWSAVVPLLDESLNELERVDRDSLLLRYFEQLDLRAVGKALGISDDAAQKRVSRALDRLREQLESRGVTSTAAALAAGLTGNAVVAAPSGLASTIASTALAAAASGGASINFLILMSSFKLKLAAGSLLVLGVVTPLVLQQREIASLRREAMALQIELTRVESRLVTPSVLSPQDGEARRAAVEELLRLRGEVARLRRTESPPPTPPYASPSPGVHEEPKLAMAKVEGIVPSGGAILTGGWVTGPHRRAFLMVTPQPERLADGTINVRLLTQWVEADESVLLSNGLDLTRATEPNDDRLRLTAAQSADLISSLGSEEGVQLGKVTEVSTADGTTGKFAWTQSDRPDALDIQVLPVVNPDDGSVQLTINTQMVPFPSIVEGSTPNPEKD